MITLTWIIALKLLWITSSKVCVKYVLFGSKIFAVLNNELAKHFDTKEFGFICLSESTIPLSTMIVVRTCAQSGAAFTRYEATNNPKTSPEKLEMEQENTCIVVYYMVSFLCLEHGRNSLNLVHSLVHLIGCPLYY